MKYSSIIGFNSKIPIHAIFFTVYYRFPLAPAGASGRLLFNALPIASLTSGWFRIVFCTSHSFTLPFTSFSTGSSPAYGLISKDNNLAASISVACAVAFRRSSCWFNATSGFAFAGTADVAWRSGPICENAI